MVDINAHPNKKPSHIDIQPDGKIKLLMGRTPNFFKSKFLSVLGSSNDIINGISNRLDISLSLSTSSDTETTGNEKVRPINRKDKDGNDNGDDDSFDENIIDFESRKVKERRAYEEVLSGKYRHPNFVSKLPADEYSSNSLSHHKSISVSNSNYSSSMDTKSLKCDDRDNPMEQSTSQNNIAITPKIITSEIDCRNKPIDPKSDIKLGNQSSASTSEYDLCIPSISLESSDLKMWIRSESENSVPSWASSISLDSHTEEADLEFMRQFVSVLFEDSSSITLELKSQFGLKARTETGRLWYARLVSAQRSRTKRVNETTFYSLVQYFAIVLFECAESDDFSPAKILMNMCFTFYHEIDVPGCEPYREYLYIYLREQPIWHSLRFWNAAFFDSLQCERLNKPIPKRRLDQNDKSNDDNCTSSIHLDHLDVDELKDDQQYQQNISFGQLGTFTCNMHAFGLSRELCSEFLKKQSVIASLTSEQERLLQANINRMYKETAKWRV